MDIGLVGPSDVTSIKMMAATLSRRPARQAGTLIVVRICDVLGVAWRNNPRPERGAKRLLRSALARAARRILRSDDLIAMRDDLIFVALASRKSPIGRDIFGICERFASALRLEIECTLEIGWTAVRGPQSMHAFLDVADDALDRGRRMRERNNLLAAVGHELRTPLTSIRGYLETVLDEEPRDGRHRRFLLTAQREATRLERFVDGLMAWSLLDMHGHVQNAECDLLASVEAACDIVAPTAQRVAVEISTCIAQSITLACPEDALVAILTSLLENAIKYGSQPGRILIDATSMGQKVCLSVHDDGPGIALGDADRIFTPVQRGRTARGLGSGLGLAIAKSLIEQCRGDLLVGRSPLGGARFDILLDCKAEEVVNTANVEDRETSAYATFRRSDDRRTRTRSR